MTKRSGICKMQLAEKEIQNYEVRTVRLKGREKPVVVTTKYGKSSILRRIRRLKMSKAARQGQKIKLEF